MVKWAQRLSVKILLDIMYVHVSMFVYVRLIPFSGNPVGTIFLGMGIGNSGFRGLEINDSQSISKPNFRDPLVLALVQYLL